MQCKRKGKGSADVERPSSQAQTKEDLKREYWTDIIVVNQLLSKHRHHALQGSEVSGAGKAAMAPAQLSLHSKDSQKWMPIQVKTICINVTCPALPQIIKCTKDKKTLQRDTAIRTKIKYDKYQKWQRILNNYD